MKEFSIYTVCTGHYKYGLFALLKSLQKMGYDGPVVVATDKSISEIEHLSQVEQVIISTKHIFGNLKARIILEKPSSTFLYLDPDIIVTNPSFVSIIKSQIQRQKLIVSAEGIVARNEIRRWIWNEKIGNSAVPLTDFYYSGGLLAGNFEMHKYILKHWDEQIHKHIQEGKYFRACDEFPLADQDILNAVLQNIDPSVLVSIGMPDWIGTATGINPFHEYGHFEKSLFIHATGGQKTWTIKKLPKRYPNSYDKEFYKYYLDPILDISSDLKFSWLQRKWLEAHFILPFYNKLRTIF